jgi:hypothetical protein
MQWRPARVRHRHRRDNGRSKISIPLKLESPAVCTGLLEIMNDVHEIYSAKNIEDTTQTPVWFHTDVILFCYRRTDFNLCAKLHFSRGQSYEALLSSMVSQIEID